MPGKAQRRRGAGQSATDHDGVESFQKTAPERGWIIISRKYASLRVLSQARHEWHITNPDKNINKNIFVSFNISAEWLD
jgi:hypothetical protein